MSERDERQRAAAGAEAEAMLSVLAESLPTEVDGREAVLTMKKEESNHWRQVEWAGFYFEHAASSVLPETIGGGEGPEFENTTFDYESEFIWDFKAHSTIDSTETPQKWAMLNAADAVETCLREGRGLGFIVAHVVPEFEAEDRPFREWHARLKGKTVESPEARKKRTGKYPRPRKTRVVFDRITAYYLESIDDLERGLAEGWLTGFQKGMRNSNGNARKGKFNLDVTEVPDRFVVAEVDAIGSGSACVCQRAVNGRMDDYIQRETAVGEDGKCQRCKGLRAGAHRVSYLSEVDADGESPSEQTTLEVF